MKVLFGLPLRQMVGQVASLLEMVGQPDYPFLCCHQLRIAMQILYRRFGAPNVMSQPSI